MNESFTIGGDLPVRRLGFGAARLSGPELWGPPADHDQAVAVARRAVELGVTLIDTADSYGPGLNEELLAEALWPYPADLVITTKVGQTRPSMTGWRPLGRPDYLRQQTELSLRRLRLDHIDLFHLHRIDPTYPADEQIGVLAELRAEGKVRHVGLSEVTVEQLEWARSIVEVVSVQNLYNVTDRKHEAVVDYCEREGIAFISWSPVSDGDLAAEGSPLADVAAELSATPAQVAIAWLLRRSPVMIPIPGTSRVDHLEENVAAAGLTLTDDQYARLSAMGTNVPAGLARE